MKYLSILPYMGIVFIACPFRAWEYSLIMALIIGITVAIFIYKFT